MEIWEESVNCNVRREINILLRSGPLDYLMADPVLYFMILSTLYQILEEGEMLLLSVPNYPLRSRLINSGLYRSSNYSRRLGSFRSLDSVHGSQFDTIFCSPTSLTPPALTRTFSRINVKKNRGLSLPFLCKKSDENFDSPLPAPNVRFFCATDSRILTLFFWIWWNFLLVQVSGELLAVLQRWDVPWPWQAFVLTNIACALRCCHSLFSVFAFL